MTVLIEALRQAGVFSVTSGTPLGTVQLAVYGQDQAGNNAPVATGSFEVVAAPAGGGGGGGGGGSSSSGGSAGAIASGSTPVDQGTTITSGGGTLAIVVPANAVQGAATGSTLTVSAQAMSAEDLAKVMQQVTNAPAGFRHAGRGFIFSALVKAPNAAGADQVSRFARPIRIEISLSAEDLAGFGDPNRLGVFRVNDDRTVSFVGGKWNASTGKLVVELSSFSRYIVADVNRTLSDLDGHWACRDVELMANKFITDGFPDGTFRPDQPVTRAEFTAFLLRAMNVAVEKDVTAGFTDVNADAWFRPVLATAVKTGLVRGYEDNTFGPNEAVTREQIAALIGRALKQRDSSGLGTVDRMKGTFTDSGDVASWAVEDLSLAWSEGIIGGRAANVLAPATGATRAEALTMIARFWKK